jgi:hypothetical protein
MLMHADLHCLPQRPQFLHFSVLIIGLKSENFEKKPNNVPTGQIVLQYVLPPRADK